MKLRVFTAFSGYDSQCMALQRIAERHPDFEFELVGWSEIERNAIAAHDAVFPQWRDRNYGDICEIDWTKVPDFDLFTYSSPCQDFSLAGVQRGGQEGSGTRSSLLWECRRAILAKRPRFLLLENVSNLVSEKFIKTFSKWEQELASYGYDNYYKVLNAKDYGVPQNRERVFLVSFLHSQIFNFPKPFPLELRLKDVLEDKVAERYYLSEKAIAGLLEHNEKHEARGTGFLFKPKDISVNGGGTPTASQQSQATRPEHTSSARIIQVAKLSSSQNSIIVDPEGISPTICNGAKDGMPKIAEVDVVARVNASQDGKIVSPDGIAPALCVGHYNVTKIIEFDED